MNFSTSKSIKKIWKTSTILREHTHLKDKKRGKFSHFFTKRLKILMIFVVVWNIY